MTKWLYPTPIEDLEAWRASNMDILDPSYAHRLFWPDRPYQADMDILSVGCGANQAPAIALTNPAARVVGIETSQEALDHNRYLRDKHSLTNLELQLLPIEEVGTLGRTFDLVISSRSLNFVADPAAAMRALGEVLRPEGVAAIMLFARYGRFGVETMQSVFSQLGLRPDEESLRMVRTGLGWLNPSHPARIYLSAAPGLSEDTGLAGTFLHGRERSYTVQDCLDLVEGAGLVFQDWVNKSPVYPPTLLDPGNEFLAAIDALPERQTWSVMEEVFGLNDSHTFIACRSDRPARTYRIDFSSPEALDYVPAWRPHAGIDGERVFRIGLAIEPAVTHRVLAELVDGTRSIRGIAAEAAGGVDGPAAVAFFEQLWRLDFLAINLR